MSMCHPSYKTRTPTRVKTKEREDVDINRLVAHGAAHISAPPQTFADLTSHPASRGEAIQRFMSLSDVLQSPQFQALLSLPAAQAMQAISALRPQAPKRVESNAANQAGSVMPSNLPPGPSSVETKPSEPK